MVWMLHAAPNFLSDKPKDEMVHTFFSFSYNKHSFLGTTTHIIKANKEKNMCTARKFYLNMGSIPGLSSTERRRNLFLHLFLHSLPPTPSSPSLREPFHTYSYFMRCET